MASVVAGHGQQGVTEKAHRFSTPVTSVTSPNVISVTCRVDSRGYIDPHATFGFVERPSESDIPFDMYTGEFTHHGTSCTFETLVQRFNIADRAVARLGQIVHDLDMKERRYAPPEAPAVERMVAGLQEMHPDDLTLLQHGIGIFEALARSFRITESTASRRMTARSTTKRSRP